MKESNLQRFRRFHSAHPQVYDVLLDLSLQFQSRGRMKWSIWGAFQVARWQRAIAGLPDDFERFKLSNDYTGYYSRMMMEREPVLAGFFDTKPLKEGEPVGERWWE